MPAKKLDLNAAVLQIAEELEAGARFPNIKKYKPHEKQRVFHASSKKKKLYIGGNRSGKTTGGVTEAIWRATCTHPYRPELNAIGPNRGRVVAVDFVQGVEKIIFPQYKQWLYPSAIRGGSWTTAYSASTRTLHFTNGSTIEFMSYDQQLDKFAGTSRHWTHFDEEPPKPIWLECLARLVDTNGEWWMTMTPVEGMTWIYDDLYEKNIDLANADRSVEIIEINTLENPYLTQEGILNLVESMDDEDTKTRIGGGFVRQGGRIYKNFDPTPGSMHVLPDSIRDPKTYFSSDRWLWILSLDHGLNNPTAVLWTAVNDDGFCVVFDEWYKSEFTVEQHAEVIKRKIKEHGRFPDLLVADPAIVQRSGISGTNIQEEYQKYGLSFILGNNDVKAGLIRVKKYFNQHAYPGAKERRHPLFGGSRTPPGSTDTVTYVDPTNSQRYPRLLVDPKCAKLIWELKRYRWKTYADKKKQYENNPYDEPHKKDDHACDSLRYCIMTRPDLAANNNETSEAQIREALRETELGVSRAKSWVIADPNNRYESAVDTGWTPDAPISNSDGWAIDEHMGGIM